MKILCICNGGMIRSVTLAQMFREIQPKAGSLKKQAFEER